MKQKNTSCHKEPQIYIYIGKNDVKKKVKKKVSRREEKKMRDDETRRRLRFAPDRLRSCRRLPFRETSACPRR